MTHTFLPQPLPVPPSGTTQYLLLQQPALLLALGQALEQLRHLSWGQAAPAGDPPSAAASPGAA